MTLTVDLTESQWRRLERLSPGSLDELALVVLDHVDQGVVRSGPWERQFVENVFGEDGLRRAGRFEA